jgi:hypothetical protein
MHLIEIFLPLSDNDGKPFDVAKLTAVRATLTQQFGGCTAFTRAPAHGVSKDDGKNVHDDIVVIEVMADVLDREFWERYRRHLEREFEQDEILIRATEVEKL